MSRLTQADSDGNTRLPIIEVDLEVGTLLELLVVEVNENNLKSSFKRPRITAPHMVKNCQLTPPPSPPLHSNIDMKIADVTMVIATASLGPNDEQESDRLDMLHEMLLVMMDRKLFLAPIESSPERVLNLGAGTGIWVMNFADNHPPAEVVGMDLSPIQPQLCAFNFRVIEPADPKGLQCPPPPPNARFLVDDFEEDWVYQGQFDLIHSRYLAGAVHDAWGFWDVDVYSEDGSIKGTSVEKYYSVVCSSFTKAGFIISPGPHLGEWLREAGFKEIHVQKYRAPVGGWPKAKYYKTIGVWNLLQAETGFEAGAMAVLTRFEGWSQEEVNHLVSGARKDIRNPDVHPLADFYVVYGRKPKPPRHNLVELSTPLWQVHDRR
ncbi:S-adenosyl-L-methionine-dependent methyltransferase [Aspergillus bertholletiae]|uniref:S-adenosyl-L-methionine-dependent methyltransferase n=1 Tax=Aspergillus bertholletiae TaxID=1226010 RepID=A0A5N7B4M9_9EURO|nr:S-adenosyl-L-methionine-dependent methyltransferase [Aspergillus bertholletiae]